VIRSTLRYVIADGRVVASALRPLHLRLEQHDDATLRVALGIETQPGKINWTLILTPGALAEIMERVAQATRPEPTA